MWLKMKTEKTGKLKTICIALSFSSLYISSILFDGIPIFFEKREKKMFQYNELLFYRK